MGGWARAKKDSRGVEGQASTFRSQNIRKKVKKAQSDLKAIREYVKGNKGAVGYTFPKKAISFCRNGCFFCRNFFV